MKARIALPIAAAFLLLGVLGWSNPEFVDSLFEEVRESVNPVDEASIVALQKDEKWLVVVVDFDDAPAQVGRDVIQAQRLLDGDDGAQGYVDQLTAGASSLEITYVDEVVRAAHVSTHYGHDQDGERDVGLTEGGPAVLAAQIVEETAHSIDWEDFDLDGDGSIDRLLILHTATPQEDGSGSSNRIWSHFGPLMEPVPVSGGLKVHHYTMASLKSSNYRGTMIHEMLHQIGALDLYAVHDETVSHSWYGVGEWDIMASGNWNGNGAVPALPMAASMELLGVERHLEISDDDWSDTSGICSVTGFELVPISTGGQTYRMKLADGEWLWMENRGASGFDTRLPGHGLLVSVQNINVGDMEGNVVNHNPDLPWLYVVEADAGDELKRAADKGSEGDTFQAGDTFGANGIPVRDSHGRLVQWTAEVSNGTDMGLRIDLSKPDCDSNFEVLPPSGAIRTLPGEAFSFEFRGDGCAPQISLMASDGRNISSNSFIADSIWSKQELRYDATVPAGRSGLINGQISCGNNTPWDIEIPWSSHSNRIHYTLTEADVPIDSISQVVIELEIEGDDTRAVNVVVSGPLERIASVEPRIEVSQGSTLILNIDPNGLITPGMLAKGEIIFVDDLGQTEKVEVELTGESISGSADIIRGLRNPSTMSLVVCSLAALWVVLGIDRKKKPPVRTSQPTFRSVDDFHTESLLSAPQQDSFHPEEY